MNCTQINQINLVELLSKLGYNYASEKKNEVWYLSPFREEKNASFKVNRDKNIWYDFGLGKGGNTIDFICEYNKCDIPQAIKWANAQSFSFHTQITSFQRCIKDEKNYSIIDIKEISSQSLIYYLQSRKLAIPICQKYCKEVSYRMNEKNYFGVGFKNDSDGYEIRNKYFKGCLICKDITTIINNKSSLKIFESWSDFLAYLTLYPQEEKSSDYIILNSISMIGKLTAVLSKYAPIKLYLDNDNSGRIATQELQKMNNDCIDCSNFYSPCKDINEFLYNLSCL